MGQTSELLRCVSSIILQTHLAASPGAKASVCQLGQSQAIDTVGLAISERLIVFQPCELCTLNTLYLQPKSYLPVLPPDQAPEKFDLALYHSSDSFLHLCTPGPSGRTHTHIFGTASER